MKSGDVGSGMEALSNTALASKNASMEAEKKGAGSARADAARNQSEAERRKMNSMLDARLGRRNGETIKNNPVPEVEPLLADLATVPAETPIGNSAAAVAAEASNAAGRKLEKLDAAAADEHSEEKRKVKKIARKHAEEKLRARHRQERRNESEWEKEPGLCDDVAGLGGLLAGAERVSEVIPGSGDRLHQMALVNGVAPKEFRSVPVKTMPMLQRPKRPVSKAECERRCGKAGFCDPSSEFGCGGEYCRSSKDLD